jgi:hypothetical protein
MPGQRKYARIPVEAEVLVKLRSVPGREKLPKREIVCRTSDVSASGMRLVLVAGTEIPKDAVAELRIQASHPPIKFEHVGTVRWVRVKPSTRGFVIGLELTDSDPKAMDAWRKYVDRLKPGSAEVIQKDEGVEGERKLTFKPRPAAAPQEGLAEEGKPGPAEAGAQEEGAKPKPKLRLRPSM